MRLKNKATILGYFVVFTVTLVFAILIIFSTQEGLSDRFTYIMRFQGSLKGLHVGSDVEYRGIKIGKVYKIELQIDPKTAIMIIPIWIRFYRHLAHQAAPSLAITYQRLQYLIKKGLRAQLQTSNLLTGDQVITLVFKPEMPVELYQLGRLEIPTIPTVKPEEILK